MLLLRDWQNFYILTGTAAATLMGLLFVSISVGSGLPTQQSKNLLQTFVNPILLYYFQVLLVACLAVMPLESPTVLNCALAVLSIVDVLVALKVFWRIRVLHKDDEIDFGHWIWHFWFPLLSGLLFVGTTAAFFLGEPLATMGLAITDLLCLAVGLRNTWVLMIWLLLHRADQRTKSDTLSSEAL